MRFRLSAENGVLDEVSKEGGYGLLSPTTPLGDHLIESVKGRLRDNSEEWLREAAIGVLEGLGDILVDLIYGIALVGGGVCIVLKVAGWRDGYRWASILQVSYVLIRYILGG